MGWEVSSDDSNRERGGTEDRARSRDRPIKRETESWHRIEFPSRFFRRNLCPIMNLHSVDSVRSGVNAGACVVREPAWDSWPIGPTRVHDLAPFSAESEVLTISPLLSTFLRTQKKNLPPILVNNIQ